MAHVPFEIPAALAAPVRDTVFLLYQATAEALHFALRAHGGPPEPLEEVHGHRARLAQLDALLSALGWPPEPPPRGLELTAPPEVLGDALHGALIEAGERLASACDGSWRGEADPDDVRSAATEVIALDRLLRRVRE